MSDLEELKNKLISEITEFKRLYRKIGKKAANDIALLNNLRGDIKIQLNHLNEKISRRVKIKHVKHFNKKQILDQVSMDRQVYKHIEGRRVNLSTLSLRTFKQSDICANCGLHSTYFIFRKQDHKHWLELYGVDNTGKEIKFESDHIFPKSKGGLDDLFNRQTLCQACNVEKGNKIYCEQRESNY